MPKASRSFPLSLSVLFALSVGIAPAQSQVPAFTARPTLTLDLLSTPSPTPGVSIYQAILTGYVFTPADLSSLNPTQMNNYSVYSFSENTYELQPGASVLSVQGTTAPTPDGNPGNLGWTLNGDARIASPVVMSVPEDPLPPSDPYVDTFLITVTDPTAPNGIPFSEVPFYYTTGTGQVIPFVPEPSPLVLLGVGLTGILGFAARRRRV